MSPDNVFNKVAAWFSERMGLAALIHLAEKKEVPQHRHSIWYYFGGMTLFLFVIQFITGGLLMLYYRPSPEGAFESVQFIMTEVKFGWLIRSIHSWSANLMIAALFIHMFSVFLLKAYRPPREGTWLSGVVLLGLALFFGFSGYLLPWNTLSYFATKVGSDIAGVVPGIGPFLLRFLRGGDEVTGATLTRFYGIHIAILPGLITLFMGIHLYLVQLHGMSVPPSIAASKKPVRQMKFIPNFLLRDLLGWLLALGVLAALAAIFPWELGEKADPFAPAPAGIRPEWYFAFMFQTLKYIPAQVLLLDGEVLGILAFGVGFLLWFLVPFFDKETAGPGRSRLFQAIGLMVIMYILVLTVLAYTGK